MNIQQLIQQLIQNGYVEEMPGRYFYLDNMQGTWVNVNNGEVGVLMAGGTGHVNYDLTNPDECYDAYVEALAYQFQIAEPSVTQAIRIHHNSRQMFDIMESAAPGRFNVPTAR